MNKNYSCYSSYYFPSVSGPSANLVFKKKIVFKKQIVFKETIRGSGFSEVFHYNSHLVGYEVFGVATIVGLAQVLHQGRTVGDPTHKVVGGCVGVVVGEVEHCEVLFAVAFDFHFCLWDFKGLSMGF